MRCMTLIFRRCLLFITSTIENPVSHEYDSTKGMRILKSSDLIVGYPFLTVHHQIWINAVVTVEFSETFPSSYEINSDRAWAWKKSLIQENFSTFFRKVFCHHPESSERCSVKREQVLRDNKVFRGCVFMLLHSLM